jgi:hypothetical protein
MSLAEMAGFSFHWSMTQIPDFMTLSTIAA